MKWSSLLARTLALIQFFVFRFENLISGPKSYQDFGETDPWSLNANRVRDEIESGKEKERLT